MRRRPSLTCISLWQAWPHLCSVSVGTSGLLVCHHRVESAAPQWCHPYPEEGNTRSHVQHHYTVQQESMHWNNPSTEDYSTTQSQKSGQNVQLLPEHQLLMWKIQIKVQTCDADGHILVLCLLYHKMLSISSFWDSVLKRIDAKQQNNSSEAMWADTDGIHSQVTNKCYTGARGCLLSVSKRWAIMHFISLLIIIHLNISSRHGL